MEVESDNGIHHLVRSDKKMTYGEENNNQGIATLV